MSESSRVETVFVGRSEALQSLEAAFDSVISGHGGLVALYGEPGIGKTCCAEAFARRMENRGALVLWGHCLEQPGAPPYWPWTQILREYTDACSADELQMRLGDNATVLTTLAPELAARLGLPDSEITRSDQPEQRFRLFDALTRTLAQGAADLPMVLIIDDLHWADPSSLSLLEHLSEQVRHHQLLIVCAYRDMEVTRKSALLATLGELTRSGHLERIRLSGLDKDDTGALASAVVGEPIPASVVDAIFLQTDGNPLFVNEVAKVVADERRRGDGGDIVVDVPDGVREAIGRRLNRLSGSCNDALTVASVVGRDFDVRVIAHVLGLGMETILAEVDEATRAGILNPPNGSATQHRFVHALIRETLYDEIPTPERLRLHQRIAEALRVLHDRTDDVLSELAYHACEAAVLGGSDAAVELSLLAAQRDERVYAFEEALRHYDMALRALSANSREQSLQAAQAYFHKSRITLAMGQVDLSLENLTQGVGLARRHNDPVLFSRYVEILVRVTSNTAQQRAVPLLEEALQLLPEGELERRSAMLAHLAFSLRDVDPGRIDQVGAEGVAIARRIDNPDALVCALRFWLMGLRARPETLPQRLALGREMVDVSRYCRDSEEMTECWYWHLLNLIEAGAMADAVPLLHRYAEQAAALHFGRHLYQAGLLTIALRLLRGEWSGIEALLEQSLKLGNRLDRHDPEGVYGAQMFQLNRDRGLLRTMAPVIGQLVADPEFRPWAPGLMMLCLEAGLEERARDAYETLASADFATLPRDDMWITSAVFCAETCTRLHDTARAGTLYAQLLPYADQIANHPTVVCFGSAALYLGMLAETMGDRDTALHHLHQAVDTNRSMQAWPALARSQAKLGQVLSNIDPSAGHQLLREAEQLATRLEMSELLTQIGGWLDDGATRLPDGLTAREADVVKLLAIGRSNKDISRALGISLSTVATHVRSILDKTGCANRTEAAAYAIRQQLN